MKRDMELVRQIVLAVRETDKILKELPDVGPREFAEHVHLLREAGLVDAAVEAPPGRTATRAMVFRLTWAGHDFADSIVDDSVWAAAREKVLEPAASWSFGVLTEFLKYEVKRRLGLPE